MTCLGFIGNIGLRDLCNKGNDTRILAYNSLQHIVCINNESGLL